jgi:hypothetical protein
VSTLREILNYVQLPVPVDTILKAMTSLGVDELGGTRRLWKPCTRRHCVCSTETRLWGGVCTDWTHLDQQQFKEACDELATAIDHPIHMGFRRRLRHKTAPQPPSPPPPPSQYAYHAAGAFLSTAWALPMAAAPTQPPAPPAGRLLLSEHVRGSTRSAVLCGETGQQHASPHQPSPRSMEPQTECMSGTAHEEETEELAPHTVCYPITKAEISDGWDTLVNRYWLQCSDCHRWRNVPKAVRDEVSVFAIALHAPSLLALNQCCLTLHAYVHRI